MIHYGIHSESLQRGPFQISAKAVWAFVLSKHVGYLKLDFSGKITSVVLLTSSDKVQGSLVCCYCRQKVSSWDSLLTQLSWVSNSLYSCLILFYWA